jgi:hypothetical protein
MLLMAVITDRISLKEETMSALDDPLTLDGVLVLESPYVEGI